MSDYKIGYGRPPKNTQFKPGQSGNPKGRKKGSKNLNTILMNILNTKITIETPFGNKKITKKEAIAMQLVNQATTGDTKAIRAVLPWIVKVDEYKEHKEQMLEDIEAEDKEILKGFIDVSETNNSTQETSSDIA